MKNTVTGSKVTIWNRNFVCVVLTNFMLCVAHFSVNPLVASYAVHLGSTALIMGLLTGLFFGVAFAMRPVAGPVTTKFDKRKLMIMVFALGGFVNIGYALFHNIPSFVVFRFLHGVQYSLVGSLIMTLAGDNLPKEKMASGMGFYGLGGAVGMAIGPSIGINLLKTGTEFKNESFGFTCVFLFAMVILFLAVIPSYILSPDRKSEEDKKNTGAWYKNIASVHAIPATVVMFFIIIGWAVYNAYIVEFSRELGIAGISAFFTVLAFVLIISRPLSGWLSDRFGVAMVIIPAIIIFGISFIIVGMSKSLPLMLVGAGLAAIGYGSTQPALLSMCIQSETSLKRAVASNTMYIGIDFGFFLGPIIGSIIFEMYNFADMFKSVSIIQVLGLISFIIILPIYHRRRNTLDKVEINSSLCEAVRG
ncbi:MAG: MFS transporter [Spirochaetes bacterium]|nr:MFS transporter [Spirochaetota bacterium]